MKKSETLELITYCAEKWGAAAPLPPDRATLEVRAMVWLDALADLPASDIRAVLAACEDEFPPNVTQLRARVLAARGDTPALPAWDEFWAWVHLEASRSSLYTYDNAPEFACPWPALEGVVTLSQVSQWARDQLDSHDLELILQAHVRRTYEARSRSLRSGTAATVPALQAWQQARALPLVGKRVDELEESR